MATSDGTKAIATGGSAGDDDMRAVVDDADGTIISSGLGNDTLRGGRYDDILTGGAGNDQMFGGLGADQFRFFGTAGTAKLRDAIEGGSDTDFIRDLTFGEGDSIVLGGFGAGTFTDFNNQDSNAFDGGSSVQIFSYQGLKALDDASDNITLVRLSNGNLGVAIEDANGNVQNIVITGGVAAFDAANAPAV